MHRSILVIGLLLLMPAAAAQGSIYLTADDMSGDVNNIRYDASSTLPEAGKAYAAFGQGATTYRTYFDHAVQEDLAPGAVQAVAYLSCDHPTVYRPGTTTDVHRPTASVALLKGETVVDSVSLDSTRTCDGPDDVWEAIFELDGTSATYAPGDTLSLEFLVWWANPPPGDGQNGYFVIGGEQASGLFGPGLPGSTSLGGAAPSVVYGTFNGTVDHGFGNATDATYVLNTTVEAPQEMRVDVAPDSGNVTVVVRDAEGELYNATFADADDVSAALDGAPGTWSVEIRYEAFAGTLQLSLHDEAVDPSGNTTEQSETQGPTSDTTSDMPANGTAGAGQDSPALPVVVVLIALAIIAVRRR